MTHEELNQIPNPTIELDYRRQYGKEYYYPRNAAAETLVKLANRSQTLTKSDLTHLAILLNQIGFEIELDIQCHPRETELAHDF